MQNDIVCNIDNGKLTALTLLDLSAAFDTTDHDILLQRLHRFIGFLALPFCGLVPICQTDISGSNSCPKNIGFGVPLGSLVGAVSVSRYTASLSGVSQHTASLSGVSRYNASLSGVSLYTASLSGVSLYTASHSGVSLYTASQSGVRLYNASLSGVSLYTASQSGVRLYNASLSGVSLYTASLRVE